MHLTRRRCLDYYGMGFGDEEMKVLCEMVSRERREEVEELALITQRVHRDGLGPAGGGGGEGSGRDAKAEEDTRLWMSTRTRPPTSSAETRRARSGRVHERDLPPLNYYRWYGTSGRPSRTCDIVHDDARPPAHEPPSVLLGKLLTPIERVAPSAAEKNPFSEVGVRAAVDGRRLRTAASGRGTKSGAYA